MYGSEELANEIVLVDSITGTTVIANEPNSQDAYGIFNLTLNNILIQDSDYLEETALFLASKYALPQYRFDALSVRLNSITTEQQASILNLEIGSMVKVTFLPSGTPPPIVKFAEVIRINHEVDVTGEHVVMLGLATIDVTYLVLDDPEFGMLDNNNVLGF
jgi:hypothetical protein